MSARQIKFLYKKTTGNRPWSSKIIKVLAVCAASLFIATYACAQDSTFCIAKDGRTATIVVDGQDWKGVIRAAKDLGDDIGKVTGKADSVMTAGDAQQIPHGSIIIGTIGKSKLIDRLVRQKKRDTGKVRGQWESFVIDIADGNLVVAGSDKRGTIYGIYTISEHIGVSPWYWWADVPVRQQSCLYWDKGRFVQPSPKVKYRGIFINDEWPSFGGWATEHFGGLNSKMYAHLVRASAASEGQLPVARHVGYGLQRRRC